MTQTLQELDRWMTEQEFEQQTGINSKTSITQVKKLFAGVNVDALFPFNNINTRDLDGMRYALGFDEYLFIERLYTIKHLLVDADMIKLCQSVDNYVIHYMRHRRLLSRVGSSYTDIVEYVSSMETNTSRYHNVSRCYERVCDNAITNSIKIIKRLVKKRPFHDMDRLTAINDRMIIAENNWRPRKELAVCRSSVVNWCKLPKVQRPLPLKLCEIVMNNTRLWKNIARFI